MIHHFTGDFLTLARKILAENKTISEWALLESDDMFQSGKYVGGFDGTEMEFTFSVYEDDEEYWFQLSLEEISEVISGKKTTTSVSLADR